MNKDLSEIITLLKDKKNIEAEKKCFSLIQKTKTNFELFNIYGLILFNLKRYNESITQWEQAIKLKPDYHFGYNNLGNVFLFKNDFDQALKCYEKAIEIKPDYYEAINNKANIFFKKKDFQKAIGFFNNVIDIKQDYIPAYQSKAETLKKLGRLNECLDTLAEIIKLNPFNQQALFEKGDILFDKNLFEDALEYYERVYAINSEKPFLLGNILHTKSKMCVWKDFNKNLILLEKKLKENKKVISPYTGLTLIDDPSIHLKSAQIWATQFIQEKKNLEMKFKKKNEKIKIGYYSSDFRTHAMGHLMVKMLEDHNKENFEIFGFYFGPKIKENDQISKRIMKSFDKFIDVNSKNDFEIASLSREMGINIAVDLMCYTGNYNKFGIFAKRCAPIQINFLGYPGTSGSKFIDYIVLDKKVLCKDNRKFFSEKFIILPDTYQPNEDEKKISLKDLAKDDLGIPAKKFVFACFNSHQKILPGIFNLWMNILKKTNESVLWLYNDNVYSKKNLKKEAENLNIDPNRLLFANHKPFEEHLKRFNHIDLFLDSFPYNAHTTCSDALRMGVPVLTLKGKSFASRVATSLLTTMDLNELITDNFTDYEKLAVKIGKDSNYLKYLKNKILKNKIRSNVFKSKIFTKNLEEAYKKVYNNYVEGFDKTDIEL
jgi:protein O-GlcNAc transferase